MANKCQKCGSRNIEESVGKNINEVDYTCNDCNATGSLFVKPKKVKTIISADIKEVSAMPDGTMEIGVENKKYKKMDTSTIKAIRKIREKVMEALRGRVYQGNLSDIEYKTLLVDAKEEIENLIAKI